MSDKEVRLATQFLEGVRPSYRRTCCGVDLRGLPVLGYPHDGGYRVPGYVEKQWLYVVCPKCGYQMSFEHMDISRDWFTTVMEEMQSAGEKL